MKRVLHCAVPTGRALNRPACLAAPTSPLHTAGANSPCRETTVTTTAAPTTDPALERRKEYLRYVTRVERVCAGYPAARVALRAGLRQHINSRATFAMNRYLARWLPANASDATQQAYFTVAALIAAQPRPIDTEDSKDEPHAGENGTPDDKGPEVSVPDADTADAEALHGDEPHGETEQAEAEPPKYGPSLGVAFAEAVAGAPGRDKKMREDAAESRLNMLTRQSASGLHRSLPASVLYLRSLDVPIDWAQLLADLIYWPNHSGRIARRWLQDYYRRRYQDAEAEREDSETDSDRPASDTGD